MYVGGELYAIAHGDHFVFDEADPVGSGRWRPFLCGFGLEVEEHPVEAAEVRAYGLASLTNLIVRRRYGAGPTVALNAHGDVVPPGDGWTRDPYGA